MTHTYEHYLLHQVEYELQHELRSKFPLINALGNFREIVKNLEKVMKNENCL